MRKLFMVVLVAGTLACGGCNRAYWAPNWDKAESERQQVELMERQTIALERIATILENK